MTKQLGMEVSFAAAEAVKLAGVDVIAAYPITPQTHIVERLSDYVANGELDAEFIPVESEHSALSVCLGSEAAGARSFTCTSSQGLALMNEIVYIAPAVRLPLVMILVNRSLSGPLPSGTITAMSCPSAIPAGYSFSLKTARKSLTTSSSPTK